MPGGDRPAGATPVTDLLVRLGIAAYREEKIAPRLTSSSADANMPMSLGIPAVTLSRAATGDRGHSLDEWIETASVPSQRVKRLDLLLLLAAAGLR